MVESLFMIHTVIYNLKFCYIEILGERYRFSAWESIPLISKLFSVKAKSRPKSLEWQETRSQMISNLKHSFLIDQITLVSVFTTVKTSRNYSKYFNLRFFEVILSFLKKIFSNQMIGTVYCLNVCTYTCMYMYILSLRTMAGVPCWRKQRSFSHLFWLWKGCVLVR